MSSDELRQYVKSIGLLKNPSISILAEGYGNINYLISEGDKNFVLRKKKGVEFPLSLAYEFSFLSILKEYRYTFVPEPIHLSVDQSLLIESFLPGTKIPISSFTTQQLDIFASQLAIIHSIDAKEARETIKRLETTPIPKESPAELLDTYGYKRLHACVIDIIGKDLHQELLHNLESQRSRFSKINPESYKLTWGDVQSDVILDKGGLYFYDFEHTRVSQSTDLAYIYCHTKLSDDQYDYLVRSYTQKAHKNIDIFKEEVSKEVCTILLNDTIWAAMKWSETREGAFKKLTLERMNKFKSFHNKSK